MSEDPRPVPSPPRRGAGVPADVSPTAFATVLNHFLTNIDSLASTLPLALAAVEAAQRTSVETLRQFTEDHALVEERLGETRVQVPPQHWLRYNKLAGRRTKFAMALRTVPSSFLVSLVSQFDAFLGDLLKVLFEVRPETLNVSDKALTLGQLIEFGSIDDARAFVIEKEVETVLRKSHIEQFDWLEAKFGLPLRKGLTSWSRFVELTERRNLLVHAGGVVSTHYLGVCRSHGAGVESGIGVGKSLKVSREYFDKAYETTFEIGVKLVHVLWRKVLPQERAAADESLSRVCYELLEDERWSLARELLDFATCTLKEHSSDELRRRLVINRAQAYKWAGDEAAALKIIDDDDWSASSDIFRLAEAVVRNDFERAVTFMHRVGAATEKANYRDWPLFREFRKSKAFLEAYQEIYGEPFTIPSNAPTVTDIALSEAETAG